MMRRLFSLIRFKSVNKKSNISSLLLVAAFFLLYLLFGGGVGPLPSIDISQSGGFGIPKINGKDVPLDSFYPTEGVNQNGEASTSQSSLVSTSSSADLYRGEVEQRVDSGAVLSNPPAPAQDNSNNGSSLSNLKDRLNRIK